MKISFDGRADALYIQFRNGKLKAARTVKLMDGVLVDLTSSGKLLGLEVLDASTRIPLRELGHLNIDLPMHT